MIIVAHNMAAMNTNRQLNIITGQKGKSAEKLSSGYRINRAADDAAGLAISEKMRWNIRGLDRASLNIKEGISYVQVTEGALGEVHSMLDRLKELTVQGANDTNTPEDRNQINLEIEQIKKETERIFDDTDYNGEPVFNRKFEGQAGPHFIKTKDNNFGLVKLMNVDGKYKNVTTDQNLSETLAFTGQESDWVSSGIEPQVDRTSISMLPNNLQEIFNTNFGTSLANGSSVTVGGNTYTYDGSGLTRTYNSTITDSAGQQQLVEVTETIGLTDSPEGTNYASNLTKITKDDQGNIVDSETHRMNDKSGGGGKFRPDGNYASVSLDFSGLGTQFHIKDMDQLGFASLCGHQCGQFYSVAFTTDPNKVAGNPKKRTTANGVDYVETTTGLTHVLDIDISGISDDSAGGEKLVAAIVDAASNSTKFAAHWEQYAYKKSEPGKLYMYENAGSVHSGQYSSWQPVVIRDDPPQEDLLPDEKRYLMIQASSLAHQAIRIERPVMTLQLLGVSDISVSNFDSATRSVNLVDSAKDYISSKRAYLGSMQNRLEHAYQIDDNISENTQASESRIRDTDMAKEMVFYSMQSILQQAGQSMLAQANQINQGVLDLLH